MFEHRLHETPADVSALTNRVHRNRTDPRDAVGEQQKI
jgi:hypothetical protein